MSDSDDSDRRTTESSSKYENDYMKRCANYYAKLNEHRKQEILCDVTIVVEGKRFPVHKIVLAVSSSYFSAMFLSTFTEKNENEIEIQDISAETFALLLDFIYGDKKTLTFDNLTGLYIAGDMLCVDSLISTCRVFMKNWNMTSDINGAYEAAKQCEMEDVLEDISYHAMKIFMDNTRDSDVVDKLKDYLADFDPKDLSYPLLCEVLKRNLRYMSEQCIVPDEILDWTKHKPEERLPDQALTLLSHAQFQFLELDDFSELMQEIRKMETLVCTDHLRLFREKVEALYHKSHPKLIDYCLTVVLPFDKGYQKFNLTHWQWVTVSSSLTEEVQSYVLSDGNLYVFGDINFTREDVEEPYKRSIKLPACQPRRSKPTYSVVKGDIYAIGVNTDGSGRSLFEIHCLKDYDWRWHWHRNIKITWHLISTAPDSNTKLKSLDNASSVVYKEFIYFVCGNEPESSECFSYSTVYNCFTQVCTLSISVDLPFLTIYDEILYVFPKTIVDLNCPVRLERIDLKHQKPLPPCVMEDLKSLYPILGVCSVAKGIIITTSNQKKIVFSLFTPETDSDAEPRFTILGDIEKPSACTEDTLSPNSSKYRMLLYSNKK